jgi:hypothetical protein
VARRWWEEQPDGTVWTCLLTCLAVLRLLTNKIAMNGMPITSDHSLQAWQQLQNDPRSLHIEAEPIDHEPRFVALVSGREPTPNLWTDAWLAASALSLYMQECRREFGARDPGWRIREFIDEVGS